MTTLRRALCLLALWAALAGPLAAQTEGPDQRDPNRPKARPLTPRGDLPWMEWEEPWPEPEYGDVPTFVHSRSNSQPSAGYSNFLRDTREKATRESTRTPEPENEEFLDERRLTLQAEWDGRLSIRAWGACQLPDRTVLRLRVLRGGRPIAVEGESSVAGGRFVWQVELPGRIPLELYRVEAAFLRSHQTDPEVEAALDEGGLPARIEARATIGSDHPADLRQAAFEWRFQLQPFLSRLAGVAAALEAPVPEDEPFDASAWAEAMVARIGLVGQARREMEVERAAWHILPDRVAIDSLLDAAARLLDATWLLTHEVFAEHGIEGAHRLPMPEGWAAPGAGQPALGSISAARAGLDRAGQRLRVREVADLERDLLGYVVLVVEGSIDELAELRSLAAREKETFTPEGWNETAARWLRHVRHRGNWYRTAHDALARRRLEAGAPADRLEALAAGHDVLARLQSLQASTTVAVLRARRADVPPSLAAAKPLDDAERELRAALRPIRDAARAPE